MTWPPTVRWSDTCGAYVMGQVAMFYCPWCGARLPDDSEHTLEAGRRQGTWIAFDEEVGVTATVSETWIQRPRR